MKGLVLAMLAAASLQADVSTQTESVVMLEARIRVLERALDDERQRTIRNGVLAGAFALGLTGFGLYRRRVDAARLSERFGMTDALTGLKNRRYVTQTIAADCEVATRQHRTAAAAGLSRPVNGDLLFVLIDIDNFKAVNERFGHAVGDEILVQIADALRATCRTSDTIARWGGEEFLAILRFTNRETAPISAERIRMAIEQRVLNLGERTAGCTCSIGFAPFPLDPQEPEGATWEHVVSLAEEALRKAKLGGGNTWVGSGALPLAAR